VSIRPIPAWSLPSGDAPAVSDEADWWPASKLFGRHLTPWMATRGLLAA